MAIALSARLSTLFGGTEAASGMVVTPDTAMRATAVYACVQYLARSIAAMWAAARPVAAQDGAVVELDPGLCEPSAIADRVPDATDATFEAFVDQIREEGQHTPILVRRHPTKPDRYEIAYGRRRTRAATALGKPVRAVVQDLTDAELVIAQGSENLAREDLSYIERAHFARNMERAGIARDLILKAMAVHRTELDRYLDIAESIPAPVLTIIGPAPKVGRPRWLTLADRIRAASPERIAAVLARRIDVRAEHVVEHVEHLGDAQILDLVQPFRVFIKDVENFLAELIHEFFRQRRTDALDGATTQITFHGLTARGQNQLVGFGAKLLAITLIAYPFPGEIQGFSGSQSRKIPHSGEHLQRRAARQLEDGIAVVGIMKGDGLDHRTADFGQRHAGIK